MTRVPRGTIRSSRGTLTNGTNMRTTKAASITQLEVLGSNYWMPAKHLLSYELRMLLFQAYDYFWLQKTGLNGLAKHPGMSGRVRQFRRTLDPALLQGYEQAIG